MKDFYNSDYSINKNSENIVYRFLDGTVVEITKESLMSEKPKDEEMTFKYWKELSDDNLRIIDNKNCVESKHTLSMGGLERTTFSQTETLEDSLERIYEQSVISKAFNKAKKKFFSDENISEIAKRRFKLYIFDRIPVETISEKEKVKRGTIYSSLEIASRKFIQYMLQEMTELTGEDEQKTAVELCKMLNIKKMKSFFRKLTYKTPFSGR